MTFKETINFVKQIHYGRNANHENFSLIIIENKGTCSFKHAFLKDFANKNNIPNVELFVGIYKMNEQNRNIGTILFNHKLEYIPETHCYLKIESEVVDVTNINSDFEKIKNDLLTEIEINPNQVSNFKLEFYENFIKK